MEIRKHNKLSIIDLYGVDSIIQSYLKDDFVNLDPIQKRHDKSFQYKIYNIRVNLKNFEITTDGKPTPAWKEVVDQIDVKTLKLVLENWFYPGEKVKIKDVKVGEYFRLTDSPNAPVWIRCEYDRSCRKYSAIKFDDINHDGYFKGDRLVYIGFTF